MKTAFSLMAVLAVSLSSPAVADLAIGTEWQRMEGGAVRLIRASTAEPDGTYKAGLEFKLEPGWHTYWRYPGEAGIPTEATFSGSTNLADAELLFPAPKRYSDGFSTSLVYKDRVVLPLVLQRESANRTAVVNMTVSFGVCQHICIPAEQQLSLVLPRTGATNPDADAIINSAFASLPTRTTDEAGPFSKVEIVEGEAKPVLAIAAAVSAPKDAVDLFVEGPAGSYNGVPELVEMDETMAHWHLPLTGFPRSQDGLDLTLTLVTPEVSVEHKTHIPLPDEVKKKS